MQRSSNLAVLVKPTRDSISRSFTIISKIGRGNTANVYLASDGEEQLAIKVCATESPPPKTDILLNELHVLANLPTHPQIIDFKGYIEIAGQEKQWIGYAMEYLRLGTLFSKFLPLNNYVNIIESSCYGLDFLHRQRLIHADYKPTNILIDPKYQPKLCDFGLATDIGNKISPTKEHGALVGTLAYMSPERFSDDLPATIQMDIYSVGFTILRHFNSKFWESEIGEFWDTHKQLDKNTFLRDAFGFIPPDLLPIIIKCTYADPEKRYQSVAELIMDLKKFRESSLGNAPSLNNSDIISDDIRSMREEPTFVGAKQ